MLQVLQVNVHLLFSCAEGQNLLLGVFQLLNDAEAMVSSVGCRGPHRREGVTDYVTLITLNNRLVLTLET